MSSAFSPTHAFLCGWLRFGELIHPQNVPMALTNAKGIVTAPGRPLLEAGLPKSRARVGDPEQVEKALDSQDF